MDISVIVPCYNEEKNIEHLHMKIAESLRSIKKSHEIIFIDDGSSDSTLRELEKAKKKDKNVKIVKFRRNFGQTASWDAGFHIAQGNVVITMDADLQNDPKDIQSLLKKLDEGYDVVSGWRADRKDPFTKRMFSIFSRFLRRKLIGDKVHDSGCSLKAYRKEALSGLRLHGEMHRYIAELLALKGFKIGEVKVNHNPRKYGKTKYNLVRLPKGFLDLIVVAFWQKYSARPIHLFGGLGIIFNLLGFLSGSYLLIRKFFFGDSISNRPLLLLSALLVIVGLQFLLFGLIADILIKIYYSEDRTYYSIERII